MKTKTVCWLCGALLTLGGLTAFIEAQSAHSPSSNSPRASGWKQVGYIKAANPGEGDEFGFSTALSADGNTLAVGAKMESNSATGINPKERDHAAYGAGAVYVYARSGNKWVQQAYLKASNTGSDDQFGFVVTLSGDGNTLAVSAPFEDSNATGINGNQADNSFENSGAVYVFSRSGATWSQQAYIKASNPGEKDEGDQFGYSVSL